jgi:hypothetical protein
VGFSRGTAWVSFGLVYIIYIYMYILDKGGSDTTEAVFLFKYDSSMNKLVSDLDRSMHISLWVLVAHKSFIEGSHRLKIRP